jgi:hypothetical protein
MGVPNALNSGRMVGEEKELEKEKVVMATLGYARELESIV